MDVDSGRQPPLPLAPPHPKFHLSCSAATTHLELVPQLLFLIQEHCITEVHLADSCIKGIAAKPLALASRPSFPD